MRSWKNSQNNGQISQNGKMCFFVASALQKWPSFSKLAMKWPIWQPCVCRRGRLRNVRVDCFAVGLYCVTIKWQWIFKCSLQVSVASLAFFSRIWACFFVELRVFLKTCRLLVFGLVLIEICLFFGLVFSDFYFADCFFPNFMALLPFQLMLKAYWACFCENLLILGLFFPYLPPWFFIWFSCWFFVLLNFPANAFWACFSVKLPSVFFKDFWKGFVVEL